MKLKNLLKSPKIVAFAPIVFAISQIIIIGYDWIFQGYAGDLKLTISRYVGLELWTSILFGIFNLFIIAIMLRYYLLTWKKMSLIWLICGIIQIIGFFGLSIFPHISFIDGQAKEVVSGIHVLMARTMFVAMFCMGLERLRLATLSKKNVARVCLAFLAYGLIYIVGYGSNWDVLWNTMLLWETGYIYAFMGMLILTRG